MTNLIYIILEFIHTNINNEKISKYFVTWIYIFMTNILNLTQNMLPIGTNKMGEI